MFVAKFPHSSVPLSHSFCQSVPAEVVALTCDTTGTLIASHYVNIDTKIACIFGTGCNAAYMERVADIPKISHLGIDTNAEMAINCEWVSVYPSLNPSKHSVDLVHDRAHSIRSNTNIFRGRNMISPSTNPQTSPVNRRSRYLYPSFGFVLCPH